MWAANEAAEHGQQMRLRSMWAAKEAAEHGQQMRLPSIPPARRRAYRRVDLSGGTLRLYCRGVLRRGPYRHAPCRVAHIGVWTCPAGPCGFTAMGTTGGGPTGMHWAHRRPFCSLHSAYRLVPKVSNNNGIEYLWSP